MLKRLICTNEQHCMDSNSIIFNEHTVQGTISIATHIKTVFVSAAILREQKCFNRWKSATNHDFRMISTTSRLWIQLSIE